MIAVTIDRAACCGHGACVEECPELFAIDASDGLVELLHDTAPLDWREAASRAAEECPTDAIVISLEGDGRAEAR